MPIDGRINRIEMQTFKD